MRAAVAIAIGLCGCGELRGATEFSDAYFREADTGSPTRTDAGPRDAAGPDAAVPNALLGDYHGELLPPTRAAYLLNSAKTPGQPWILYVSTKTNVTLPCEFFKTDGWNQALPMSAIAHGIHLSSATVGTQSDAFAGRTTQTFTALSWERAKSAKVTLTRIDALGAAGNVELMFETYVGDDPASDAGPSPEPVRGDFEVTSCSVDW